MLEPAQRNRRLVRSMRPILQRYADLHPLILVVEDYHWLDASSVEVLAELFAEMTRFALLLLVTTRPERRLDRRGRNTIEIELKHLPADHADHLLQELIGGSDELAPLRGHIIARADGTPFFLEEFARSLHESGALAKGPPGSTNIVIPASVQSILAARIDRLSPLHRRILQIASVIGRDVPLPLLAAVADMPEATVAQEIEALHAAGFLVEVGLRTGIVHSFSHALTQAVAYDGLLRSDRRAAARRVLQAMKAQGAGRTRRCRRQPGPSCRPGGRLARGGALCAGCRRTGQPPLGADRSEAYLETAIGALGQAARHRRDD